MEKEAQDSLLLCLHLEAKWHPVPGFFTCLFSLHACVCVQDVRGEGAYLREWLGNNPVESKDESQPASLARPAPSPAEPPPQPLDCYFQVPLPILEANVT